MGWNECFVNPGRCAIISSSCGSLQAQEIAKKAGVRLPLDFIKAAENGGLR